MAQTDDTVVFNYHRLHKSWRKGESPPSITFVAYSEDTDICVVSALREYLKRSEPWRENKNESQLLLSYINPHQPIASCTVARWMKELLSLSGIDTDVFKAHSTRSASTSKTCAKGLSEKDILKRGTWKRSSTWQRFYKKNFEETAKKFQEKLFKK